MKWSNWLQGGPFLEVSFILELKEKKQIVIQDIIKKLSTVRNKIEVVDKNINEIIDFFDRGYFSDDADPLSINLHSLRLRLYVYVARKRKATLQLDMVSANALLVNFWFYASECDEPKWGQIGVKKEELTDFTRFLEELYFVYEFKIGATAIEEDVLKLFGFDEEYPKECYRFENLTPTYFLHDPSPFVNIIWNEKYKQLSPTFHTITEGLIKRDSLLKLGA